MHEHAAAGSLDGRGDTLAEAAGAVACLTLGNHPRGKVGNDRETLQAHNTGNEHITGIEDGGGDILDGLGVRGKGRLELLELDVKDDIKEQEDIEADEIEHRPIEMEGEITGNELRPGSFPFSEKGESPHQRTEDGHGTETDLLDEDSTPPADLEDDDADEHHDLVKEDDDTAHGGAVQQGGDETALLVELGGGSGILTGLAGGAGVHHLIGHTALTVMDIVDAVDLVHGGGKLVVGVLNGDSLEDIHIMSPAADGIGKDGKEIKEEWPGEHDSGDKEDTEDLQGLERLTLDEHLPSHDATLNGGEDGSKGQTGGHDILEGGSGTAVAVEEEVHLHDDLVDLLIEEIDT